MFSRHSERSLPSASSREIAKFLMIFCGAASLKSEEAEASFSLAPNKMFAAHSPMPRPKFLKSSSASANWLEMYSAAPLGVSARRSAAKSQRLKSTSCPTAEIVGTFEAATARATISSLKHHKSSKEPPPRVITSKSKPKFCAAEICAEISRAASAPWTREGRTTISPFHPRLRNMLIKSLTAAPVGEVTTPILRGKNGMGFFLSLSKSPSFARRAFSSSNFCASSPAPSGIMAFTTSW